MAPTLSRERGTTLDGRPMAVIDSVADTLSLRLREAHPLYDQQLIDHMDTLRKRLSSWLQGLPPAERLEALATVHDSLGQMRQMVKSVRRDTLVELIDQRGIERVSAALGVTEERVLRLIAERVS